MTAAGAVLARALAATAVVAVATALPWSAPAAGAAELAHAGWWTTSPVPVAPDAGDGELVVQGSSRPDEPFAFAAVEFRVAPDESSPALVLAVAEGSASTPSAALKACRVVGTFEPTSGGAMADAPAHDCEDSATASLDPDGTYTFFVGSFIQDDRLAVAVLPTAPSDRVVFEAPDATSLESQPTFTLPPPERDGEGDAASPSTGALPARTEQGTVSSSERPLRASARAPSVSGSSPVPAPDVAQRAPDPAVDAGEHAPAAQVQSPVRGSDLLPASATPDEGADPLAVILLLVLTVAGSVLWFAAGRVDPEPLPATVR